MATPTDAPIAATTNNNSDKPATTSRSSVSKRPPALSDIAAKLKIEDKIKASSSSSSTDLKDPSPAGGESPSKGLRLPAAGRLNPGTPAQKESPTPAVAAAAQKPAESSSTSPATAPQQDASPDTVNKTPATGDKPASGTDAAKAKTDASPNPDPSAKSPQRTASGAPKPEKPKLHPLQHVWSLYFDSKSHQNSSAAPSPNPATPGLGDKNKDKELQQQQQQSPSKPSSSSSTLQPPGSAPPSATPGSASVTSGESWEAQLKFLGKYNTVEAFFKTFATLRRPSSLDRNSNYHLFKDGIKPMWEDPANAGGGKWVLTLRGTNPALLDRTWMWLVLALIGEDLDDKNEITGAVCSTRPKGDRIALWIRIKDDIERVNRIGRRLVSLLDVEKEPGVSLEFVSNSEGRRGSAFRSHGGHHNAMRNGGAGGPPTPGSAGLPASGSDPALASEGKGGAVGTADTDSNKADDSTSSIGSKPALAAPAPSKYISFSNPPPQFGPGGPQQQQHGHQQHQHQHQQGGGSFHLQQGGGMPGFGGMPGVGMPNGMPGMPGVGGFPPGFLPPGMNSPQQQQQQQQMGIINPMGMFPPGAPLPPQYLAAAAAAGIPPQNMHYFQHQLALQQQAFFAQQAQMMAAQQQQHGGGSRGAQGGVGAFGTSPEKGSPSKFGNSPAGIGRRGSEMGLSGGGAFGGFGRRGSDVPSEGGGGAGAGGAMGAFGSPIGRKTGGVAMASGGSRGSATESK
ncbi:hypothetical protein A4X13_0g4766 [Tilletia indica]|uniref:Translation initiation factor eIF4e n=1 Tax=Tilletia indica TaxID=43049 RepID=A0A177TRH7_9BASI|nr:hypothetical protein A4X13_0g4766 [Tilletia indica]